MQSTLINALIPKDESDDRNAILEVRSGTYESFEIFETLPITPPTR